MNAYTDQKPRTFRSNLYLASWAVGAIVLLTFLAHQF